MRGTRRALAISSDVIGRASGSACAASSTSCGVIGRIGVSGIGRSLPSASTSTTEPSGRIFAIVVVLLMPRCSPSRDDPILLATLRVCDVQNYALPHSKQVDTLLSVVLTIVDPFDREWVAQCLGALLEAHAVAAPVFCGLRTVPFERVIFHF